MQINLPFADDAEFARLHEAVRLVLPIIPALAASSPYAEGHWSGFLDYRLEAYLSHQQRVPSTMGDLIPDSVASKAEYETRVLAPMFREIAEYDRAGILQHEWLNVRAAVPRFDRSAIEIRIADVQECPQADIAVAAAVIALVRHLYETDLDLPQLENQLLLSILRGCIESAEKSVITEERYLRLMQFPGKSCTAAELWQHLLGTLQREGTLMSQWLTPLQFILKHGTLASRLLQAVGIAPPA
jgi:gamma-glutamyl:cysteine ligase YbdK (ATP-grasp superfamily)